MADRYWKPSPLFAERLQRDRKVVQMKERHAGRVVREAKAIAPIGHDSHGGPVGSYQDSIHVETDGGRVRVVASDWKARWIEFGTGEPGPTRKYAVLRKAARRAGLRFRSRRKR